MSQQDDELKRKEELWRLANPEMARITDLIERVSQRVEVNEEEARQRTEENQRTMDFVIQQQAQFASDIQTINGLLNRLATVTLRRFETVEGDASNLETKMEALVDSHIRLADAQAQTDGRLSAFITTVERVISQGRNGGKGDNGGSVDADS